MEEQQATATSTQNRRLPKLEIEGRQLRTALSLLRALVAHIAARDANLDISKKFCAGCEREGFHSPCPVPDIHKFLDGIETAEQAEHNRECPVTPFDEPVDLADQIAFQEEENRKLRAQGGELSGRQKAILAAKEKS